MYVASPSRTTAVILSDRGNPHAPEQGLTADGYLPGLLVRRHVGVHLRDPWLLRLVVSKARRTIDAATPSPCDGQAARQVRISPSCCVRTVPGITRSRQGARRHAANSVEVGPSRQDGTIAGS